MIPLPPWAARLAAECAVAVALFGAGYWRGHASEAEKFAQFRAAVTAAGEAAKQQADQENAKHEQVTQHIAQTFSDALPGVQDEAVRRYRTAHPDGVPACSGGGGMPQAAASAQGADAASGGQVAGAGGAAEPPAAPTDGFVRDCAADALKVLLWQRWVTENGLPVE